MKVHRIITTIEIENDNSIISVQLINLNLANADILLAVTDITTNGNADGINKAYAIINNHRPDISSKLKDIACIINDSLDNHESNVVADDNSTNNLSC